VAKIILSSWSRSRGKLTKVVGENSDNCCVLETRASTVPITVFLPQVLPFLK